MAVSDNVIIIILGFIFSYLVIYRSNKLFGNLAFAGVGLALISLGVTNIENAIGIIILLGSVMNAIYDLIPTKKK